jgi:hypothetical protein
VKIESEVFTIGAWRSYEELEEHLSLPELFAALDGVREKVYSDREFLAELQGGSLSSNDDSKKSDTVWEDIKARAFSGGRAKDAKDILSLSGDNAQLKGFGIGNGLEYFDSDETRWWDE